MHKETALADERSSRPREYAQEKALEESWLSEIATEWEHSSPPCILLSCSHATSGCLCIPPLQATRRCWSCYSSTANEGRELSAARTGCASVSLAAQEALIACPQPSHSLPPSPDSFIHPDPPQEDKWAFAPFSKAPGA